MGTEKLNIVLTSGQAAAAAGVSIDTVKRWIFNGELKATLSNSRRWQIRESDLSALLKAKQEALNNEEAD